MISWIDDQAIIELFHMKSRVIPVPGHGWDNSGSEKGIESFLNCPDIRARLD